MNINKTFKMIVAAALLAVSFNASAAFITGDITMSGDFAPTGGTGMADATGLDFLGDDFDVDDANGDFALAGIVAGDVGTYNDFDFSPLTAGTEIWSIGGFAFALDVVSIVFQNGTLIALEGTGILSGVGFDDTAAVWNLTANNAGMLFNLSSGTTAQVAEPATLALIGLGFIGLAAARRRA